jgi:hypothetical protein
MSQFTKMSLAVEYEGQLYFVALPKDRESMALQMIAACCDGGKLPLRKAPADYKFQVIGEPA